MLTLEQIEYNFLKVANLDTDLSIFPIKQQENTQALTSKEKSKEHGQVFTPLWLVDKMIVKAIKDKKCLPDTFLDLCAGYGQFSIRWLRCLKKICDKRNYDFNLEEILKNRIFFSELQLSSCHKLIKIFGIDNINLFIGDSTYLNKLSDSEQYRGIYVYSKKKEKWLNISKAIYNIYDSENEEKFIDIIENKIYPKL